MRRPLAVLLCVSLLSAVPGSAGYVLAAPVLRAPRTISPGAASVRGALRTVVPLSAPYLSPGALPGAGTFASVLPSLPQVPEAAVSEVLAVLPALSASPEAAPAVARGRTVSAGLKKLDRALSHREGANRGPGRKARVLGAYFDNVRPAAAAQDETPVSAEPSGPAPGLRPARKGGEDSVESSASVPAPEGAEKARSVPYWSALPWRGYARWVGWWLQPFLALAGAERWHEGLASGGWVSSLAEPASVLGAGSLSVLAMSLLTGTVAILPAAVWRSLVSTEKSFWPGLAGHAAAAAVVGGLYGAALLVPLGTGLPSMALTTAAVAAYGVWALYYGMTRPGEIGEPGKPRNPSKNFVVLGAVAPLFFLADKLGGESFAPGLILAGIYLLAALDAGIFYLRKALREAAEAFSKRFGGKRPASPDRRSFLGGAFSFTGLAAAGATAGASAAMSFFEPLDKRFYHVRPDIRLSDDGASFGEGEVAATERAISESMERLKTETDPKKAALESYRLNIAVKNFINDDANGLRSEKVYWDRSYGDGEFNFDLLAPAVKFSKNKPVGIGFLLGFLEDSTPVGAPSAGAREMVLQTKRRILDMLSDRLRYLPVESELPLFERLSGLLNYSEVLSAPDPRYPAFGFSEEERLSLGLRTSLESAFKSLGDRGDELGKAARAVYDEKGAGRRRERYNAIADAIRIWLRSPTFLEEDILTARLERAREEAEHSVPLHQVKTVREMRKLPRDVVAAVAESASVHGLDAGLFMTNVVHQVERRYYLSEGLSIYANRNDGTPEGALKASIARSLARLVPRDVQLPVHWNDFLGGVLLAGKNGMGLFQIRPANVRRFPEVWARFGVPDAGVLSDREIAYRLMDTRYNVEAWAVVLKGMAREVDGFRARARLGEELDFSEYEKESRTWFHPRSKEEYALMPSLESAGEDFWRLTAAHPLLKDKAAFSLDSAAVVHRSGIFDRKPGFFSGAKNKRDIETLTALLEDSDSYLRDAALRTLEAAAADPAHPERERARRALKLWRDASGGSAAGIGAAAAVVGILSSASLDAPVTRRSLLGLGGRSRSN